MTSSFRIDAKAVEQLASILNKTELSEIEYEDNGMRIRVAKNTTVVATQHVSQLPIPTVVPVQAQVPVAPALHPGVIKSPMVGTVYLAQEPGTPPFVKVGDHVNSGQTLLIIEAMKVMNPIKANKSGKIIEIFAKDAQPVEFGEPLVIIE